MKKEISPGTMGVVIAIVVIVLGIFFYKKVVVNQPSAHPQYGNAVTQKTSTTSPAAAQDAAGNASAPGGGH